MIDLSKTNPHITTRTMSAAGLLNTYPKDMTLLDSKDHRLIIEPLPYDAERGMYFSGCVAPRRYRLVHFLSGRDPETILDIEVWS